jgi:C4-dicarboxylate transporter
MDAGEWTDRLAAALGVDPPSEEEVEALLGLAGIAAHSSERTAAPVSCWLVARAGVAPAEALERVKRLAKDLDGR